MKKTLIALAVLAASGASFAQATISGNLAMGYRSTSNIGGTSDAAAGFGVDTSEIDFAASEDLGGGWKVAAAMALAGADRSGESGNGTVNGRNASLSLTTPVGVLGLASTSAADYLSGGIAGVGAYYNGFDGKVLSARTVRDVVSYSLPVGPVVLGVSYQETTAVQGLGAGTTGDAANTNQSLTTYGATYNAGPIAANVTYLNFNAKTNATKDQTRLSGSYDLGVAKLGLGMVVTSADGNVAGTITGTKTTDTLLGLSAPMGALTLGANFVQRSIDASGAAGSKKDYTGTSVQLTYAMSKRTSLIANYATWQQSSAIVGTGTVAAPQYALGAGNTSSQYNLLLSHSF